MNEQTPSCPVHTDQLPFGKEYHPFAPPQLEYPYTYFARARREHPVFFSEEIGLAPETWSDNLSCTEFDVPRFDKA